MNTVFGRHCRRHVRGLSTAFFAGLIMVGLLFLAGCSQLLVNGDDINPLPGTTGGDSSGGGSSGTFTPVTGMSASLVLGQPDFTTATLPGTPDASNMHTPQQIRYANGTLFVPDVGKHRVMAWSGLPTTNNAAAGFVLGQISFTGSSSGATLAGLNAPGDVATDGTRLFVADSNNHRVLIWNTVPTTTGTAANIVVGTTSTQGTTNVLLKRPFAVAVTSAGKMAVADFDNHRVLLYNSVPTANGAAADVVLGQANFTTSTSATTNASFNGPNHLWTDGTKIIVADKNNNRVLIWNSWPTTNGQAADVVLGQPDFTSSGPATTQTGMNWPISVMVADGRLYVADTANHRILVYNTIPTTNNAAADSVIGQADFTSSGFATSASGFRNPAGMVVVGNAMWVVDQGNHRVLRFGGN